MKTRKHHIPARTITSEGEKLRVVEDFGDGWIIAKNQEDHFVVVHKNPHTRKWDSLEWTTTKQGARDVLLRRLSSWRDSRSVAVMHRVFHGLPMKGDPDRVKGAKRREFLRSFRGSGQQFQGQGELTKAEQRRAMSQALRAHNYRACRKAGHRNCDHILYKGGVVPEARPWEMDPSRKKRLHLWRLDPIIGDWRIVRSIENEEDAETWLRIWQKDEPGVEFKLARMKPADALSRYRAQKQHERRRR